MRWLSLFALALMLSAATSHAADTPGGQIVYPRKEGEGYKLHIMNADGTGDRLLPGQTSAVSAFPAPSPNGKRIAYMAAEKVQPDRHQVCIINADGTGLVTVNTPSMRAGMPAWSPDGKQLLFSAGDQRPNVFLADADGNGARQLNPEGTGAFGGFWMPDGKRVGYTRFSEGAMTAKIVLVNVDGSGEEPVTSGDALAMAGASSLSPDGKKLLYLSMDPSTMKASLRMWEFATKAESVLMDVDAGGESLEKFPLPAWAPDGKSFLIALKTDKGMGLFSVSEDGKTKTRLTPDGVDCLTGAWIKGG
ncbi:MAG TPA: hypothetical protein VK689_13900 [Armatimonadota bacterium]|nr:hypothetical protein [Armatimonadota bacterium]